MAYKKILLAGLAGVLFSGCAMDTANSNSNSKSPNSPAKAQKKAQTKEATPKVSGNTLLDFSYPIEIAQEPLTHHTVGVLFPHIQVTDNLKPYINRFENALANQIKEIFQKRGYQVETLANRDALTPEQKHKMWSVSDVGGWIGILEDVKMDVDNPEKTDTDTMVDQSSGAVWLKFFEPETGRVIHNFGIQIGGAQAVSHIYTYKPTNSGGFAGPNAVSEFVRDKNNDDAIRRILNRVYRIVMKRLVDELTDKNINRYRNAIEQIKK
ncbi:HpaA family protein [Helicobacter suis]|uniref:HpaA family protein n=1 Tax=Helicobacter suis TaxID=104628 RepID=UPI0013D10905|nr:HpaA family protein [Helicobacter suis]